MITLEEIVTLAKEVEMEDPIDWSSINMDRENTYRMIGSSVLEMLNEVHGEEKILTATAVVTKLVVENFVLNLRLLQGKER